MPDDRCELLCLDLPKAEELRLQRIEPEAAKRLAGQFKALSDPTRLVIAGALADGGEMCVCDLSWISERAENLVSHHLRQLHHAGLVERRRDGKMVMYALNARGRELVRLVRNEEGAAR